MSDPEPTRKKIVFWIRATAILQIFYGLFPHHGIELYSIPVYFGLSLLKFALPCFLLFILAMRIRNIRYLFAYYFGSTITMTFFSSIAVGAIFVEVLEHYNWKPHPRLPLAFIKCWNPALFSVWLFPILVIGAGGIAVWVAWRFSSRWSKRETMLIDDDRVSLYPAFRSILFATRVCFFFAFLPYITYVYMVIVYMFPLGQCINPGL